MNEGNQMQLMTDTNEANRPPVDLLVISVRQPWAWLIINADKDIENRDWKDYNPGLKVRGRVLIHASKGMTKNEYFDARLFVNTEFHHEIEIPAFEDLQRGGIIGSVEIVDAVTKSNSPWFFGPKGLVLRNPQRLPFYRCNGQLGFFRI